MAILFLVREILPSIWTPLAYPGAILEALLFTTFAFVVPRELVDNNGSIDNTCACLRVGGLILFKKFWKWVSFSNLGKLIAANTIFSSQAPAERCKENYEYALLIVSILHFVSFVPREWKFAKQPILPLLSGCSIILIYYSCIILCSYGRWKTALIYHLL